jgi:hypothetical protein
MRGAWGVARAASDRRGNGKRWEKAGLDSEVAGVTDLGKEAFHRMPGSGRDEWDAVECVLTILEEWSGGARKRGRAWNPRFGGRVERLPGGLKAGAS